MDRLEHLGVAKAAQFESVGPKTLLRRLERKRIILANDPEDNRRKLVPVSALSPTAYESFMKAQTCDALQKLSREAAAPDGQPALAFASPSQNERALLDSIPPAIPERFRPYIEKWAAIVGDCTNGTFRKYFGQCLEGILIRNRADFIRATAKLHGIGVSTVHQKLKTLRDINHNPDIPSERKMVEFWTRTLPKNRPGRSGYDFFSDDENAWMREKLLSFYLTQAKLSVKHAYRLLLAEIDAKQRAAGIEHLYQKPTLRQCRTLLQSIDLPTLTLAREGEKAFNDRCGKYISRNSDTLRSNDLWVTDQKQVDIRMRDTGERLGRIWMVNFLDVASDKVLGYSFGPVLNSDMVMQAAVMAIARYGVPGAVHMDLGKEFICKAFNGSARKFSGEVLYREALGLWNALGVEIVKAIGRNPQSKTIERWHANLPAFDRRFPGYCGSNTDTRPEQLAQEEAQHLEWLKTGKGHTPLITISQYIRAYCAWAEQDPEGWNQGARGRGKMRRGMTPNEAYNVKRPEGGFRTISAAELDHHSADHRFVKVARGGQINLTFYGQTIEYEAPELFYLQGADVEAIVSRSTLRKIIVIYPVKGGTLSCVAKPKPLMAWLPENRDELRAALRCKAAVHRAVRQGVKASRLELQAANPVELLEMQKALPEREQVSGQKLFGVPAGEPGPVISSNEYMMVKMSRRPLFSNERAAAVLAEDRKE